MHETARVLFHPFQRVVTVPIRSSVLEALRLAEIPFESICGGKGECGKCRVIHLAGDCTAGSPASIHGLTPEEAGQRYCLACRTLVLGNCEFAIPVESRIESPRILLSRSVPKTPLCPSVAGFLLQPAGKDRPEVHRSLRLEGYSGTRPRMTRQQHDELLAADDLRTVVVSTAPGYPELIRITGGDERDRLFGIAIDLGTTTVAGVLVNLTDGAVIAEASALNRQITFGEELLTRIAFAKKPGGSGQLRASAVESINGVIASLSASGGIPPESVLDLCIAGNTVMTSLLLGHDTVPLEQPNPVISRKPAILQAQTLGLGVFPGAYAYILPAVSRFVGGDAVGDVIASGISNRTDLALMIDLGTNGEVVLGNADWLSSVSCASGPAFEGAGISSGMRAMRGAIDHIAIDPVSLQVSWTTIGDEPPRGICGSGIIDAAASMAAAGILDFTGKIVENRPGVRRSGERLEFVLVPHGQTATGRDICITDNDMIYLMDSKAAVCGAIGVLLKKNRVRTADIRHVFLAGAFGAFSDMRNTVRFGIIPDFRNAEFHSIGNGSLSGALACLLSREMRVQAEKAGREMVYIDLLIDADFIEEYAAALHIPGKKEYFS